MKIFSYNKYIKCIHTLRLNAVLQLSDENIEYKFKQEETQYKHDKLLKKILEDKEEMVKFINVFLEPVNKIKKDNLIRYNSSYITRKYKVNEANIVYKIKNKDVFILTEHKSNVDYNMPFKMLNYCIDIIQECIRNNKRKGIVVYPTVIPILIYTGDRPWKVQNNFKEEQIGDFIFEKYKIDMEYNLVDINKCNNNFLFKQKSLFGYGMLIEKAKNEKELKNVFKSIIEDTKDEKILEEIVKIVFYLYNKILSKEFKSEILERIHERIGEGRMSNFVERFEEENIRKAKKELEEAKKVAMEIGKREGRMNTVKNMIKEEYKDEVIMKITEITKRELEEIKNQLKMVV